MPRPRTVSTAESDHIYRHTLPNGVRVVVERIPSMRSVAVGVWVHVGSRDEKPDEGGISHLIEHMVFKGTEKRRTHHIAQRMESVGGYLNAFTSKEHTCYYARGLDEHLTRAVDVVSDLVVSPRFPEGELDKEKEVILEEMKMYEDQPEDLIFDRIESVVYPDHPLGHPIIGTVESVRAITRDNLTAYVQDHYAANRVVLAIAGNVKIDGALKLAERALGALPQGTTLSRTQPGAYVPRHIEDTRPIGQAHLVFSVPTFSIHDKRRTVLSVLNTVLGGGMSSLLNQNIRERYGYCYNIYSYLNHYEDTGDFGVYMATEPARVDRARKLIFRELNRLTERPVSERLLGQAKNQVKGGLLLGLENMSSRMTRLGRQELYFDRILPLDEISADVDAVTADDLISLAQELFVPESFSSGYLLPQV